MESNNEPVAKAELSVSVDVGNLFAFDPRPIEAEKLRNKSIASAATVREEYLKSLCTESTQLIINELFALPRERVDDVLVAKLPKGKTILPREKPLPKAAPLTKWEQYAKLKGIQKKKKGRMAWDETHKEFRPRFGYGRKDDKTKEWCIEIKKNEDPNQDFFEKKTLERNERKDKNELQRLRNIARSSKNGKVPGVGLTPTVTGNPDKLEIKKALHIAKRADASMSKFSEKLKNEDKTTRGLGKKRKFESNFSSIKEEKNNQLRIFDKITSNREKSTKEKLNLERAVNKHIEEGRAIADGEPRQKRLKKAGKKKRSSAGAKPRKPSLKKGGGGGGGKRK